MDSKRLPKHFFRDNPLDKLSAPYRGYFSAKVFIENEKLQDGAQELLDYAIEPRRREQIEEERRRIGQFTDGDGEKIVKFIRSEYDMFNRDILCRKILDMQREVVPLLLRRFRTSALNILIETTFMVLMYAEPVYIDQLLAMYPEIRSPHAQSLSCVLFGAKGMEETLDLLLREYRRLEEEDPEKSYDQGPLLAIYLLFGEIKHTYYFGN